MSQPSRREEITRWTVLLESVRAEQEFSPGTYCGEQSCGNTGVHDPHEYWDTRTHPNDKYVCVGRLQLWTTDEIEEYLNS